MIALFFGLEAFLYLTNPVPLTITEFYDDIGRGRRQGLTEIFFNEGFGITHFNNSRYIGEEFPKEKEVNSIRMAMMGDSYIEALYIFPRHHFANVTVGMLEEKFPGKNFEFLNFGRSGSDIGDMFASQSTLVSQFRPDYYLFFLSKSDLELQYVDPLRPKTILQGDSLSISMDYPEKTLRDYQVSKPFVHRSRLLNMAKNGNNKIKEVPIGSILFDKVYTWFSFPEEVTEHNTAADKMEVPDITLKIVESLDPNQVIFINRDYHALPDKFIDAIKERGFQYIDLSVAFDEAKERGVNLNYWAVTKKYGHWNHEAHRIVGKKLGDELFSILQSN